MRVGIGVTLTWDEERFVVIAADYRHVVLRSLEADFTRMVDADELVRLANITWRVDRTASSTGSAARVLDGLNDEERRIVAAWAEQFAVVRAAVDNGQPAKVFFEDVRTAMSKLTSVTSLETVRRKFHRYCAEGVLGLVDARHLNRGKRDIDPRIGMALSELGENGTTRSSGTTSRTLDRLRWTLEEDYGDAIDIPSQRTLYRMVAAHPTALELNGSAKSRQTSANKPGRAFGVHGSLRPGEHVQIDSTVIDVPSRLLDGRLNRAELANRRRWHRRLGRRAALGL